MNFNKQQETALGMIDNWLKGHVRTDQQVFRLFGYAGTGKTTLAKHIAADHYAAYTGKAAHVLRSKGCHGATTIHSLIYLPKEKSRAKLLDLLTQQKTEPDNEQLAERIRLERANLRRPAFTLNQDSELRNARLLVIDECSMVGEQIGNDLLSFGCKVLVLGDPAQLPPVRGGGFFTECEPDYLLTQVHRHALDNPIYELATYVREHHRLPAQHSLMHKELDWNTYLNADQVIVGMNRTRHTVNGMLRSMFGFQNPLPEVGDKVVCTRNNHELGILNGATYTITDMIGDNIIELDGTLLVAVHREPFLGQEVEHWYLRDAEMFEYGYALTCHKAQGSQWERVVVKNESRVFRHDAARWLYTAITRASEQLWLTQ